MFPYDWNPHSGSNQKEQFILIIIWKYSFSYKLLLFKWPLPLNDLSPVSIYLIFFHILNKTGEMSLKLTCSQPSNNRNVSVFFFLKMYLDKPNGGVHEGLWSINGISPDSTKISLSFLVPLLHFWFYILVTQLLTAHYIYMSILYCPCFDMNPIYPFLTAPNHVFWDFIMTSCLLPW